MFPIQVYKGNQTCPWLPYFLLIKFVLAIFTEHPLVNIAAKLFSVLTIGFRGEDV